jgi:hypothetical protein
MLYIPFSNTIDDGEVDGYINEDKVVLLSPTKRLWN